MSCILWRGVVCATRDTEYNILIKMYTAIHVYTLFKWHRNTKCTTRGLVQSHRHTSKPRV